MAAKEIGADEVGGYPVLEEIQRQLEAAGYAHPFQDGVSLDQDIAGDGVLQVQFGSESGTRYTLFVDVMEGRSTALTRQDGCIVHPVQEPPEIHVDAAAARRMFIDTFNRFAVRRDYVRFVDDPKAYRDQRSYEQVKQYWDKNLLAADRTDGTSFPRRTRTDGTEVMGDGVIDNVDINAIAEQERTAPEKVFQRFRRAIESFRAMTGRAMKGTDK